MTAVVGGKGIENFFLFACGIQRFTPALFLGSFSRRLFARLKGRSSVFAPVCSQGYVEGLSLYGSLLRRLRVAAVTEG